MAREDKTLEAAAGLGADGIVTTKQLRAGGLSPRLAERAVASGRWQWVARGTYVTHARPLSPADLVRAARAYVDAPLVVSGALVLAELGLRWLPARDLAPVHVLVADEVRRRSSGRVRVTRTKEVTALETWTRYGAAMAMADRAVVDAARFAGSLRDVRGIVLGAVADRRVTPEELLDHLDAGQRNGSGLARRAAHDAARGCASPPEAELVDALMGRGVPFLVNPEVWIRGVKLGSPDVWVLGTAVGGEVESVERHEGDDQVESTYDRHERFADGGVELVHLSVARIRRSSDGAATHLLHRAATGPPIPTGLVVVPRGPVLR